MNNFENENPNIYDGAGQNGYRHSAEYEPENMHLAENEPENMHSAEEKPVNMNPTENQSVNMYSTGNHYTNMYTTEKQHMNMHSNEKQQNVIEDPVELAAQKAADKVRYKEEKKKQRKEIKQNKKKKSSGKGAKFVKKATSLVACAALFGGVAGGVFQYMSKDAIEELKSAQNKEQIATTEHSILNTSGSSDIASATVLSSSSGMDVSEIAANAMPSVVSVHITAIEELNQGFFGSYQYEAEGSGSGIIIDKNDSELMIVTNNHVVSDAETVKVTFIDGETYDAKVKGTDSDSDLAIIVVPLTDIKEDTLSQIRTATIGNSDELQVGEQVVAIGNALGYGQSVTTGIVSALNRENDTNTTPLIQTDAAINPGNSGGALLNAKGELIGINSSKYTSTEVEGMGYAIPISSVTDILNNLMNMKTRDKVDEEHMGYLGIECGTVTQEMQFYYGAPAGVYVSKVTTGGAADLAGLPEDSIITKLDGKSINSVETLTSTLQYYAVGDKVKVTYQVMDKNKYKEKSVEVILGKKPSNDK